MENKKVLSATFFNSGSRFLGISVLYTLTIFRNKGINAISGRNEYKLFDCNKK
jgi:hypothetical protein